MTREQLLAELRKLEGYNPRAYGDYKQYSIGYGTRATHPGEVIDRDEAERRLDAEVAKAEGMVDQFAPGLDPGTRAALVSLTYNAGSGWMQSGLGKAVRAGDMDAARNIFLQYNRAGGAENPGLVNRRQQEVAWFGAPTTPQEPAQGIRVAEAPTPAPTEETQPTATPATPRTFLDTLGDVFREPTKQERGAERSALQLSDDLQPTQFAMPQRRRVDLGRLKAALQARTMRA